MFLLTRRHLPAFLARLRLITAGKAGAYLYHGFVCMDSVSEEAVSAISALSS